MREDKFPRDNGAHMSAKQVALFNKEAGPGFYYKTHGEVYDVKHGIRVIGLLEAILDAVSKPVHDPDERLNLHRQYLKYRWEYDTKALAALRRELDRVLKMCGCSVDELDRSPDIREARRFNISELTRLYAVNYDKINKPDAYSFEINSVDFYAKKFRKILKVDDIRLLNNIGPVTVAKIKAKLKRTHQV